MIIVLIGNVCTGKTTVAKGIAEALGIPHLSIDYYRQKWNASTKGGEYAAWQSLLGAATQYRGKDVIIESSGLSGRIHDVYRANGGKKYTIKLIADIDTLIDRHRARQDSGYHVPYPYSRTSMEDDIRRMQSLIDAKRCDMVLDTTNATIEYTIQILTKHVSSVVTQQSPYI